MSKMRNFSALVFIIFSSYIYSQNADLKLDSFPATLTQCFHHDKFGFMWIGTQDGLIRYDGTTFKHYRNQPFDSTSISNNWVSDIQGDSLGNLWISTYGGGLNYFNQISGKFTRYPGSKNNDTNNFIIKIILNEDGSLWFTGMTHTLTHFKIDRDGQPQYIHYNLYENLSTESFPSKNASMTAYKDKAGMIWVGMALEGLLRFNPETNKFEQFKNDPQNPNSLSNNTVSAICEDDSGNIWIGTGIIMVSAENCGLNMYNPKTKKFRLFQHDWNDNTTIASNRIAALLIDHYGIFWIATMDNYLDTVPLKELLSPVKPVFTHHTNLWSSELFSLYQDRVANMWIGEKGFMSQKYDRQQNPFGLIKRTKNFPNSLSLSGAWCVYADHSGCVWAGTEGVDVFDPVTNNYRHYFQNNVTNNYTYEFSCIQEDAQGQIWIGTNTNGINILNPETGAFKRMTHNQADSTGLISDYIKYLLTRKNGDMWIATIAGIQLFEQKTGIFHNFDPDTTTNEDLNISKLVEDASGTLWIATVNNGLYELKLDNQFNSQVKHYMHDPQDLSSISCNAISDFIKPTIVDSNALWIATPAGLNRMDLRTNTFSHFFTKDGLGTDWIATVLEDNQGDLWCASPYDLSFFQIKTSKILNFGKSDGLPLNWGSGAFRQNGAKGLDGRLYFAGGGGILNFQPTEILGNKRIPPVRITDFKIFQKSVQLDTAIQFKRNITLNYQQNMFSFDFAALNFTSPEKNQYKYKMEGFNDNWIELGNAHIATFTNLDPGEYIFKVKGSNNHGVWNEEGASIKVMILPAWWQTWWFRIFIFIVLIALIYAIFRFRLNKIIQMERMRVQIASDLHDDIGASLTRIAVHSEIIQNTNNNADIRQSSGRIGYMSREIITTLSDIVWSIDARNDTIGDLLDRMRDFLDTVFPAGEIKIDFQTHGLDFKQKIAQNVRQNIYLIFKETVNNAAKHSGATEINIRLTNGTGTFIMEIYDNGSGFKANIKNTGHHGINNMQMRAKRIGGELLIESCPGTKIILKARSL